MPSQLNQINIAFSPVEDRLLLRMTSGSADGLAEYRLWLTRRMVRLLWPVLDRMIAAETGGSPQVTQENRDAVMQFQQEAALSKANFSHPYEAEIKKTPLGNAPLLVSKIQVRQSPRGGRILSLNAANGQGINIGLNTGLIHSVKKLLVDVVRQAQWDLALGAAPAQLPAAQTEPPRVLN
jgi:hypothetical protein